MASEDTEILRTVDLRKYFPIGSRLNPFSPMKFVSAVDQVSLRMPRGKTCAIVGESGCGKTTLAETIALLTRPTGGEIFFNGSRIFPNNHIVPRELYTDMQMVFQDPASSLDPRMKVPIQ